MMKQVVKEACRRGLRILFAPLRWFAGEPAHKPGSGGVHVTMANSRILPQVAALIQEGHTVTIHVKGYSMRPFLEHCRDKVVLAGFRDLRVGDVVLAEIAPGTFVLHRIIVRKGDRLTLMGDGNVRGVEHCGVAQVRAVVRTFIRNGRSIPADDPKLVRYGIWWRKLLPVRRFLLLCYKMNLKE